MAVVLKYALRLDCDKACSCAARKVSCICVLALRGLRFEVLRVVSVMLQSSGMLYCAVWYRVTKNFQRKLQDRFILSALKMEVPHSTKAFGEYLQHFAVLHPTGMHF